MSYALAFVAVCLLIVTAGGIAVRREFRPNAKAAADEARLTAPLAPARDDLTDSPWRGGSPHLHWVGRPIATHASGVTAPPKGYVGCHREPSTIGERALAWHFPADTQEFAVTFGTVEIGATL